MFPVTEDVGGGFGGGGAEDVRVAADHFVVDFADDVGDGEAFFFVGDLGVEEDLEEEVAKFFGKLGVVGGVESVEDLVSLFDEVGAKSGVSLFTIPRAAARSAKASHDHDELLEIGANAGGRLPIRMGFAACGGLGGFCRLAARFTSWHGPSEKICATIYFTVSGSI